VLRGARGSRGTRLVELGRGGSRVGMSNGDTLQENPSYNNAFICI
jgi:hypothetical protein